MAENYWPREDDSEELDPLGSLLSEWSDPEDEEDEFRSEIFQGLSGRRRKAAVLLMLIWLITIGLHWVSWGSEVVIALTIVLSLHGLRLAFTAPESPPEPLTDSALATAPIVSLLVAAKNEETVIARLVDRLCHLDYPADRYEVWIVDDYSTDGTGPLLDRLALQYPQLHVIHRPANAGGGKSGALNQVLPLTKGEIIGVFDADAGVTADLLRHVVPMFDGERTGAVQVRKSIVNASENFWTRGQAVEMSFDSCFQQQRVAVRGIGELRGNGQFVRRTALNRCGGWNEQTITDDLDLTIRLHLDNWKVDTLVSPAVEEEGVTTAKALWHQRNRWAEGGYQRYLDYWKAIVKAPLGPTKKFDLFAFLLIQYLLPAAAIPDLLVTVTRHQSPVFAPLTGLVLTLSSWGMVTGLRRVNSENKLGFWGILGRTLQGTIYMMHWFVIIPSVTARMAIRPKRLKWVKTVHGGENLEVSG
ncbi:glycosyltransferase family 2 protein [Pannus brasiliensis CCIBt3594]|uniref:Beta-monoglucosyldiacylglycerol synthase n=1 Tax=Pannus brasiliensis CCIBt3594 TaxID=1427578 RepID=A0AAW9QXP3_9CHRO